MKRFIAAGAAALALVACQHSADDVAATADQAVAEADAAVKAVENVEKPAVAAKPGADWARADYDDMSNWLCHPDKADDACSQDLSYTVVEADGSTTVKQTAQASNPEVDCFYIYPTVSFDQTDNSDLTAGPEELAVTHAQFARFSSVCRTFAPMYRQITISALRKLMGGQPARPNMAMRAADIKDSWNHYLENYNNGRGVILVGHSQGSGIIAEFLPKEILGTPAEDLIISAMPIGITIPVDPETNTAAGLPLCKTKSQTGCIIAYSSFRATSPPPADARFGNNVGDKKAACVNPAVLTGDDGVLDSRLANWVYASSGQEPTFVEGKEVTTPFAQTPGLLSASCASNSTHRWLSVTVNADPNDPRADDIAGDIINANGILKSWGLHLLDLDLAMGNLIEIAEAQIETWTSEN